MVSRLHFAGSAGFITGAAGEFCTRRRAGISDTVISFDFVSLLKIAMTSEDKLKPPGALMVEGVNKTSGFGKKLGT